MQSPFKFLRPAEWEMLLNRSEQRMYKAEAGGSTSAERPAGVVEKQ